MTENMKTYKVGNIYTHEREVVKAQSALEACEKLGWLIGDCWVKIIPQEKEEK